MQHIIWRVLKDKKTMMLAYCLIGIGFIVMYTAMFPSIKAQTDTLKEVMKAYPESVMKAMGIKSIDFSVLASFISMEYFSILWPLLAIMVAISLGGFSIAGEIESGTAPLLLSLPLSRGMIYISKVISSALGLAIFSLCTIPTIWPIAKIFNSDISLPNLLLVTLSGYLFGLTVLALATFLSTIFSEKGKAYFISGGLLIIMYALNVVSALKDSYSDLKYSSLFHYFDPTSAILDGKIENLTFTVTIGTSLVLLTAGYLWFSRRDISV